MIRLQTEPFDPGAESDAFMRGREGAGAMVTFTGFVRSGPGEPVESLTLECYVEMAEKQIGRLAGTAVARFGLIDAGIVHRYGTLPAGEPIVQVMTIAPHRREAFAAAEMLMDHLKTDAPFWKKQTGPDGETWVAARTEDARARARWE